MNEVVKRIDTMVDGLAGRLGISVTDLADVLSDAKDEILRLQQTNAVQPDDATVERVARAICDTLKAQIERYAPEVLDHLELNPEYWSDVSTAAIAAMIGPKP